MGRTYLAGDLVTIFCGVVIFMIQISTVFGKFKVIVDGKIAVKLIFDVVNRVPMIRDGSK